MKNRNVFGLFALIASFFGTIACTSVSGPEFKKSAVVERMGDADETPKWASGENGMFEEKGQAVYVNIMTMSGDSRTEACVRAAEERGRVDMLRYIKDNITTSGQLNEDSVTKDPAMEGLTAFLAQGQLSGVRVGARYWEKREESDTSGNRVLRLRCAAQAAISKADLDNQMRAAINRGKGGNPEIREQLLGAQKSFIDSIKPIKDKTSGD
jgi:hypothetical protein